MTREEAIRCFWYFSNVAGGGNNVVALTRRDKEAFDMAIEALSAETCDDTISRKAAQDYIAKYLSQYLYDDVRAAVEVIDEYIGELPSVTPKQKVGHWINYQKNIWIYAQCSECGTVHDTQTNYCPNCGAKMVEPQESEDKE